MKAGTDEAIAYSAETAEKARLDEAQAILQLKRPLLPIDKYAAREGVTKRIVEKYGRLGLVQIRKYKGYSYVVDVPLSPYNSQSGETATAKNLGSPKSQIPRDTFPQTLQSPRSTSQQTVKKTMQVSPKKVMTQEVTADAHKVTGQPVKSKIKPSETKTMPTLTQNMFDKASRFKKQLMEAIRNENNQSEAVPGQTPVAKNNRSQIDSVFEQAQARHTKQVVAVTITVCLCTTFLISLWLYINQKANRNRLSQAAANIQSVYDDSVQTSQQLATFQSKLTESTAEIGMVKSELDSAKAGIINIEEDLKGLRHEITKVRQSLENIQQGNTAALEQLQAQFQKLTIQLSEFTGKSRTAPGIYNMGQ